MYCLVFLCVCTTINLPSGRNSNLGGGTDHPLAILYILCNLIKLNQWASPETVVSPEQGLTYSGSYAAVC